VVGAYLGSTPLNLTPTGQFMRLRMPAERCWRLPPLRDRPQLSESFRSCSA